MALNTANLCRDPGRWPIAQPLPKAHRLSSVCLGVGVPAAPRCIAHRIQESLLGALSGATWLRQRPCVSPENAPSSDFFGHNPNRRWRMKTLAGISILALLTISGRPIPTGFTGDDSRGELNSPHKHLGDDDHAFNRSIPAFHQRAGRHGRISDCLPGLGHGNFPLPADAPRQRIAALRSSTGPARSKR